MIELGKTYIHEKTMLVIEVKGFNDSQGFVPVKVILPIEENGHKSKIHLQYFNKINNWIEYD